MTLLLDENQWVDDDPQYPIWIGLVLVLLFFGWLTWRAIRHHWQVRRGVPIPVKSGWWDSDVAKMRYTRLLLQIAVVVGMGIGGAWLCSSTEADLRALDAGSVSSVKVSAWIALIYRLFGSFAAIIAMRALFCLAILGGCFGISGALAAMPPKAPPASKRP